MDTNWTVSDGWVFRPGGQTGGAGANGRTFIISGVARGGTTLIAAALREAGLHLGTHLAELVGEDREMLAILQSGHQRLLGSAIAARNAEHRDWGFKLPNLHAFLRHADVSRFRNPHLILVFRDPVAVAIRNMVSEYFDPLGSLEDSLTAMQALIEFMRRADCPTLLLSYEKALIKPADFIAALVRFCGLTPNLDTLSRMVRTVQPSPEAYVQGARRQFAGAIDLLENGVLHGWCCQLGELEPVDVDLLLDDRKVATVRADRFRRDLEQAGFGNGNHGFQVDLESFAPADETKVEIRVSGRTFALAKSGSALAAFASPSARSSVEELATPG